MRIKTLQDMLALVDRRATLTVLRNWTSAQWASAEKWAAAEHLHASDNAVRRVPMPPHVAKLPGIYEARS